MSVRGICVPHILHWEVVEGPPSSKKARKWSPVTWGTGDRPGASYWLLLPFLFVADFMLGTGSIERKQNQAVPTGGRWAGG